MRRFSLSILAVLGIAAGAGVSSASAQDKLSVRLDFAPWGVQAAMHLAQN
jgi:NitT/TauT family transport system substrate-binding protein